MRVSVCVCERQFNSPPFFSWNLLPLMPLSLSVWMYDLSAHCVRRASCLTCLAVSERRRKRRLNSHDVRTIKRRREAGGVDEWSERNRFSRKNVLYVQRLCSSSSSSSSDSLDHEDRRERRRRERLCR